jgi:hypothetical protein
MHFDFYTALAAGLDILTLVLAGAALVFCILIFRLNRNCGWLLLGVSFTYPFYRVVWRMAHGWSPFWYLHPAGGANGIPGQKIILEFPFWSVLAVLGLFLIYRKAKRERQTPG